MRDNSLCDTLFFLMNFKCLSDRKYYIYTPEQKGEKNHKKKEGNAPRDERIFEIIRQTQMMTVFSIEKFA